MPRDAWPSGQRPAVVEDAILLAGDWRWRKGPRLPRWLAWAFGRRERFTTHLGHRAVLAWWRGHAFLVELDGER